MKTVVNIIFLGISIGYICWLWGQMQKDPVIQDPRIIGIIEDWKRDVSSVGIDGETQIKYIDQIAIVDIIPEGYTDRVTKRQVGKSDHSNRTIWILNRDYDPDYLKALVYHEIGHYLFNLKHEGAGIIMSAHIVEEPGYYKQNWDRLLPIYLEKCRKAR